jgi:glutaminyl-peptide cyclotransferase
MRSLIIMASFLALAGSVYTQSAGRRQTAVGGQTQTVKLRAQVVRAYPHDRAAFTQGLVLQKGTLFESTGLVGRSSLREVEIATGRVIRSIDVPPPVFAEGLALVGTKLFQLSWQNGKVFTYDSATFKKTGEHAYRGEGWGLCYDGRQLVMSDGSDKLTFRQPSDFSVSRTLPVTLDGRPVPSLNELECVDDLIYANVWMTDTIVRIDAKTGRVLAQIDAANLLTPAERVGVDVLNGIAYDPSDRTFLITGKLWPKMFRVTFAR